MIWQCPECETANDDVMLRCACGYKLDTSYDDSSHFAEGKSAFYNGLELSDNPYGIDTEFFSVWASGWEEALQTRKRVLDAQNKPIRNHSVDWDTFYLIGGFVAGPIAFIACWIYAIASWGFLLGVGLGWIPSLFIAVIARFIWPLLALVLVVGIAVITFILWKT